MAVAGAVFVALGASVYAVAGHQQGSVASYTGCLTPSGTLVKLKAGNSPRSTCTGRERRVHLSGGDLTSVRTPTAGGLQGGKARGAATLSLRPGYRLPQGCAGGQQPFWRGGAVPWGCGNAVENRARPQATGINTVDSAGNVGEDTSVTIGADGLGLVAYGTLTTLDLKVAHCSNVVCSSATTRVVDSAGLVGEHPSVAIGADGLGLISYSDGTNGDLKVAHC